MNLFNKVHVRQLLLRGKVAHDRYKEVVVVVVDNFYNPPVNIKKKGTKTKCLRKVATRTKL